MKASPAKTERQVRSRFRSDQYVQRGIYDLGSGTWGVRATKWTKHDIFEDHRVLADELWVITGYTLAEAEAYRAALLRRVVAPWVPVEILDDDGYVIAIRDPTDRPIKLVLVEPPRARRVGCSACPGCFSGETCFLHGPA